MPPPGVEDPVVPGHALRIVEQRLNLLITGRPGIGKSTLVQRVLARVRCSAGGIATSEIRGTGGRLGFSVTDVMTGRRGVLAHVSFDSPCRVGRYGVDVRTFEHLGVPALERALDMADLIVIDEIGRMELFSRPFQDVVARALDHAKPVLAVIQMRRSPFLDSVRSRPDVEIHTVTQDNRDALDGFLAQRLEAR